MSVKIVSHKFDARSATETVVLEDGYGRQVIVQVHVLRHSCPTCQRPYPEARSVAERADEIIGQAIAEHEASEKLIAAHAAQRFDENGIKK